MRRLLVSCLAVAGWMAACGSSSDSQFGDGPGPGAASSSGDPGPFGSTSGDPGGSSSGDNPVNGRLKIDPATATVNATGTIGALVGTATFKAILDNNPTPVTAKWSVDDAEIGTIDQNGVFSAGLFGGKTTIRAQVGNLLATAEVTVNVKIEEDRSSGLSPADKDKLRGGGNADSKFKWLYPYDRTVFPRGLSAPKLQFDNGAPRGFYVKVKSAQLEYEGFYPGVEPGVPAPRNGAARVKLEEAMWKLVTQSAKADDNVTVSVTKIVGASAVTGPINETWTIAQGSLKGTVFYNSYNSKKASNIGAVLRVKPGSEAEVLIRTTKTGPRPGDPTKNDKYCIVCHSVAAQGNRLVAGVAWGTDPDWDIDPNNDDNGGNPQDSSSFKISTTGAASQEYFKSDGRVLPFGGLTPDGKFLVGSAVSPEGPNLRGLSGTFASRVYNAATGAVISGGFFGGNDKYIITPAFSHDGKLLAFNDKNANKDGRRLSVMSVDTSGSAPTFSNLQQLAVSSNKVVGWPTFTPDAKGVIYHEGDHFDTGAHSDGDTLGRREANLKWVDVATKKVASLDALNGVRSGKLYLPYDADVEKSLNYEPTTLPVAVGGYAWVVFTSRRAFGNTIYDGPHSLRKADPATNPSPGDKPFDNGNAAGRGFRKKLWVAAIDLNGEPGKDISHPAFYLEGQEDEAGNMRGFWALDPCKTDGKTCETGDDCCGGFCRQVDQDGTPVKMCVPPPAECSNDSEKCSIDADCCNAPSGTKCIGGFCNKPAPNIPK